MAVVNRKILAEVPGNGGNILKKAQHQKWIEALFETSFIYFSGISLLFNQNGFT
mgnify:CR=1 FL=1